MVKKFALPALAMVMVLGGSVVADGNSQAIKAAEEQAAIDNGTANIWQPGDPAVRPVEPKNVGEPPHVLGPALSTIRYDDGVVTAAPSISSKSWGNRFDTQNGNPVATGGAVTMLTFYLSGVTDNQAFVSLFDQLNTGAGTANVISSPLKPGLSTGWNTVATAQTYAGSSVMAGVWYLGGDTIALGSGTNNSQGHHGMHINDIEGTAFVALTSLTP